MTSRAIGRDNSLIRLSLFLFLLLPFSHDLERAAMWRRTSSFMSRCPTEIPCELYRSNRRKLNEQITSASSRVSTSPIDGRKFPVYTRQPQLLLNEQLTRKKLLLLDEHQISNTLQTSSSINTTTHRLFILLSL